MSAQTRKPLKIEGTLQVRVLVALIEGASSGIDLKKKLNLSSSGTIYPVLHSLQRKGLIEYAPKVLQKKMYVLSERGKEQLGTILSGIGSIYFARFVKPYVLSFINALENLFQIEPGQKVLCTLDYEPIKRWLKKADVTYLQLLESPHGSYDLCLCTMVETLKSYGWKIDEFTLYLSNIVKSLRPGGTLVTAEIEKTDNIFVEMFIKEVLGYGKVIGLSKVELRDVLETYKLNVKTLFSWRGLLISVSTKSK